MKSLVSLGIGLSVVSGCLFLALVSQIHYLLWKKKKKKKRRIERDIEESCNTTSSSSSSPAKELLYLFCWKKPSSLTSAVFQPQEIPTTTDAAAYPDELLLPFEGDDSVEEELMRLHSLAGYPRLLFTIKEETKEDMESEDGRRSAKASGGKSLRDLFYSSDTSFLTPLSSPSLFTPTLTPLDCCKPSSGFNPLFESSKEEDFVRMWSSPPPKFKFLKDAEEKLYKKKLMEEASSKVSAAASQRTDSAEEDGSFITIVIGKGRDRGQQHHSSSSSQVTPLPASPSSIKLGSNM